MGEHNCYAGPVVVDFEERQTFFVLLSTESPVCFESNLGDLAAARVDWGLHVHICLPVLGWQTRMTGFTLNP